jgi:hypothetical protein
MENKYKKPTLILLIIVVLFLIIYNTYTSYDIPFDKRDFEINSNQVLNMSGTDYATDILYAGLDELDLDSTRIMITKLPNHVRDKKIGNDNIHIDALILYDSGMYTIYVKDFSRNKLAEILAHELIHLKQMEDGRLINHGTHITWEGEDYGDVSYEGREWEREAFNGQRKLKNKILNRLYQ